MDVHGLYEPTNLSGAPPPPSPLACQARAAHGPRTCSGAPPHRSGGAAIPELAGMVGGPGIQWMIFSGKNWGKTMSVLRQNWKVNVSISKGFLPVGFETKSYYVRTRFLVQVAFIPFWGSISAFRGEHKGEDLEGNKEKHQNFAGLYNGSSIPAHGSL